VRPNKALQLAGLRPAVASVVASEAFEMVPQRRPAAGPQLSARSVRQRHAR
jgi:hypothetical protein